MSFSVDSFNFEGITGYKQYSETTSDTVFDLYKKYVGTVKEVLGIPAPTAEQMQALQEALNGLLDLLQKGKKVPSDPTDLNSPMMTSYMTDAMANQVTVLFATLKMAGVDVSSPITIVADGAPTEAFQNWKNLAVSGGLLKGLFDFTSSYQNSTLFALVALDFIKHGNEMISGKLEGLQKALQVTKTALDSLHSLEELQNQIAVLKKKFSTGFNWNPTTGSADDFAYGPGGYSVAAKEFYEKAIQQYVPYNYTIDIPQDPGIAFALQYKAEHNGTDLQVVRAGPNSSDYNIYTPPGTTLPQEIIDRYHITIKPVPGSPNLTYAVVNGPAFYEAVHKASAFAGMIAQLKQSQYTVELQGNSYVITPQPGKDVDGAMIQGGPFPVHCSIQDDVNKMIALKETLKANIAELTKITPRLPDGSIDPNTALAKLQKVYDDISARFVTPLGQPITKDTPLGEAYLGFSKWVLDSSAALNIGFAVTAAQSLNDQQKEGVRQALYNYEEWVKISSAIIQLLQTIADKILQHISR